MKRLWVVLAAALVCFLCPPSAWADGGAPAEVQRSAEVGLPTLLSAVQPSSLADYGFADPDEAARAALGDVYQIYTVSAEELKQSGPGGSMLSIIRSTDMWLYLVLVDGQPRSTLWVDRMPDGYRAVQLGNHLLSRALGSWAEQLPQLAAQSSPSAFEVRFVRAPQLYSEFLLLTTSETELVAPLHLPLGLGFGEADQVLSAGDVMAALSRAADTFRAGDEALAPGGGAPASSQLSYSRTGLLFLIGLGIAASVWACLRVRRRGPRKRPL